MYQKIQDRLEDSVSELLSLKNENIFTENEIENISKRRRFHEVRLYDPNRRGHIQKLDYLNAIEYEIELEHQLEKRLAKIKFRQKSSQGDNMNLRRMRNLFERALGHYPGDVKLWHQFVDFCLQTGSTKVVQSVLSRAIQKHPVNQIPFWLIAADLNLKNGSLKSARSLLQRGLRMNPTNSKLWLEMLRLEAILATRMAAKAGSSNISTILTVFESAIKAFKPKNIEKNEEKNNKIKRLTVLEGISYSYSRETEIVNFLTCVYQIISDLQICPESEKMENLQILVSRVKEEIINLSHYYLPFLAFKWKYIIEENDEFKNIFEKLFEDALTVSKDIMSVTNSDKDMTDFQKKETVTYCKAIFVMLITVIGTLINRYNKKFDPVNRFPNYLNKLTIGEKSKSSKTSSDITAWQFLLSSVNLIKNNNYKFSDNNIYNNLLYKDLLYIMIDNINNYIIDLGPEIISPMSRFMFELLNFVTDQSKIDEICVESENFLKISSKKYPFEICLYVDFWRFQSIFGPLRGDNQRLVDEYILPTLNELKSQKTKIQNQVMQNLIPETGISIFQWIVSYNNKNVTDAITDVFRDLIFLINQSEHLTQPFLAIAGSEITTDIHQWIVSFVDERTWPMAVIDAEKRQSILLDILLWALDIESTEFEYYSNMFKVYTISETDIFDDIMVKRLQNSYKFIIYYFEKIFYIFRQHSGETKKLSEPVTRLTDINAGLRFEIIEKKIDFSGKWSHLEEIKNRYSNFLDGVKSSLLADIIHSTK
eukprot:GHVL01019352.1.p2 GENE.GHVL01019352.1~~GHVL01019352.1.p2  ORF type:complete len:765 (-),score=198.61 GHVL01019352.1:6469-8763(-)